MSLTIEEVEHIAMLSRLDLNDAEKIRFAAQLSSILEYADSLRVLETADMAPEFSAQLRQDGLRSDEPRPGLEIEALRMNAPEIQERQFKVPPVFE